MTTKKVNISACDDHKYRLSNNLELSVGYHGEYNLSRCSGCVNTGYIWDANTPRPIFLTITNSHNDDIKKCCIYCSVEALKILQRDLVSRVVAFCRCNLCNFDNTQKTLNSPEPLTICFCALPNFNILGKLSQEIFDYQRDEPIRSYKNLASERTIFSKTCFVIIVRSLILTKIIIKLSYETELLPIFVKFVKEKARGLWSTTFGKKGERNNCFITLLYI